jgi:hypothetical protein
MALPRLASPAGRAALESAVEAMERKYATMIFALGSDMLFAAIAVPGMPFRIMPMSSSSDVARRNLPPPISAVAIASPSGPWHRVQLAAYCCLPASISNCVYSCWANSLPAINIRIKKQNRTGHILIAFQE